LILLSEPYGQTGVAALADGVFLVQGWRSIFDEPLPGDEATRSFALWMNTALGSEQFQRTVCDIFADAVYGPGDEDFNDRRYITFSHLLYSWAPPSKESN